MTKAFPRNSSAKLVLAWAALASQAFGQVDYQYDFKSIQIGPASAEEPVAAEFSAKKAMDYLDRGAAAWIGSRGCIACHTTGTYLVTRPALTTTFGVPPASLRRFAVEQFQRLKAKKHEHLLLDVTPAKVIYAVAGLAEWDAHVRKTLSPETLNAFALMFDIQMDSGTWGNAACWPPFEADTYHVATVAAMALATAPGYLSNPPDAETEAGIERLKTFLRNETPPHDYSKTLLLWAASRMPGLVDEARKQALIEMVLSHQQSDGGWSIRTFASPEEWGDGSREEKLRSEPEFTNSPSDGHQTGLAIVVLREAGLPANDTRLQKGIKWLLANQRKSGRWWTRSLNTDQWHFITFSGTAYPLLALQMCDAIPVVKKKSTSK